MSARGLEGVIVAETRLSRIDGDAGRLIYGGYEIEDLAENATFEEVCHLLFHGALPDARSHAAFRARLGADRAVPPDVLELIRLAPPHAHPMAVLRTAVSALAFHDPDAEDHGRDANLRKGVRLTAQLVTLTAAIGRVRAGQEPLEARADLSHAADFLRMLTGREPDALEERIMDAALTLHAEHGMNASTFAARVTIATLSDMHSAVTSAIGTLKGPLHGGANEQVMKMMLRIETPDQAAEWVREALARGEKIMGFGHRVYRALDPRAPILKRLAQQLADQRGEARWLEIAERIETTMGEEMARRGKKIYPNVDFFSAAVYYTLGIPLDLFTCIFACARTPGWAAHVIEQLADNRLIRPRSTYAGPESLRVAPLEARVQA
jgi:citrate synthase